MLGTKFIYETIVQQARIQFFDDFTLINEWIVNKDSGEPQISVPISPGNTVYRKHWKAALSNIKNWIGGIPRAGIIFSEDRTMSRSRARIINSSSGLNADYRVRDINNVNYIVRELNYNVSTDQITISPRTTSTIIYWVDYLIFMGLQDTYEVLVDKMFMGNL